MPLESSAPRFVWAIAIRTSPRNDCKLFGVAGEANKLLSPTQRVAATSFADHDVGALLRGRPFRANTYLTHIDAPLDSPSYLRLLRGAVTCLPSVKNRFRAPRSVHKMPCRNAEPGRGRARCR